MSATASDRDRTQGIRARLGNPVVQFSLAGLLAILAIGVVSAYLLRQAGNDEATRDAKRISSLAGKGIVQPLVGPRLVAGEPRAQRQLDTAVRDHILDRDGIVRVKIWDANSRIVYSDEPRLVGDRFELGSEELKILENGGIDAETSDLSRPENRFEPRDVDLLEVYLPIETRTGERLLFETYIRSSFVSSSGQRVWSTLAPVLIGALIVLAALLLPLAASLARRLRRGQDEREALLKRAIDASELERRRIAQDLHDGVVQDLAGVSYSVAAAAGRAERDESGDASRLAESASRLRQSVRDLRGVLVEIYPPDLHRVGLGAALSDIIGGLNARGLHAESRVPDDLDLPPEVETLFFRVSQEAARNTVAHAGAEHLTIDVSVSGERARLEITDDGRGFSPEQHMAAPGHFGLRMLADLAADTGGEFDLNSEPGGGTRIRVEVPVS